MHAVASSPDDSGARPGSVSVVVPVFNSAAGLGELCRRLDTALSGAPEVGCWELILVNDGSADASWERIVELSDEHPGARGLDLVRNFGQHNALLAGIDAARHAVIVTLDDDLQDRPEEIPRLLSALAPDVDLVYGIPVAKRRLLRRRIATRTVRAVVLALTAGEIPFNIGGFRAFRAPLLEGVDRFNGPNLALDTPLCRAASGIAAVRVGHDPRRLGRSNYTFRKLVLHTLTEFRSISPLATRPRNQPTYVVRTITAGRRTSPRSPTQRR